MVYRIAILALVRPMPYQVYVVELAKKVFTESARFRAANPQFNGVLECLYVGMTSKTPQERFDQHRSGAFGKKGQKLSSNIVRKYGRYLRPSLYNHIKPLKTRAEALRWRSSWHWNSGDNGMPCGIIDQSANTFAKF